MISPVVDTFPGSLHRMRQLLKGDFVRYVTCPKCDEVYRYDDAVEVCGTMRTGKPCKSCGSQILKVVQNNRGSQLLYPIKTYCYRPLRTSLQLLLDRPDFYSECEKWKKRQQSETFSDVFDGRIWQEFQCYNGKPLLQEPFTYGLMMNIDCL